MMTKAQLQERIEELEAEVIHLEKYLKESGDEVREFEKLMIEAEHQTELFREGLEILQESHLELARAEEARNPDYIFSNARAAELEFAEFALQVLT